MITMLHQRARAPTRWLVPALAILAVSLAVANNKSCWVANWLASAIACAVAASWAALFAVFANWPAIKLAMSAATAIVVMTKAAAAAPASPEKGIACAKPAPPPPLGSAIAAARERAPAQGRIEGCRPGRGAGIERDARAVSLSPRPCDRLLVAVEDGDLDAERGPVLLLAVLAREGRAELQPGVLPRHLEAQLLLRHVESSSFQSD